MPIHCVIVPPPLYSPGSWLKDRQGYGLFSPSSFDNPIFFCVWCSSLCSLNKSPVPALIIALPPKVWCAQGNWTSPVPAHYSTIHYCLPAKHTSTYSCTPSLRNIQINTETHKKKKKRKPIFSCQKSRLCWDGTSKLQLVQTTNWQQERHTWLQQCVTTLTDLGKGTLVSLPDSLFLRTTATKRDDKRTKSQEEKDKKKTI